MIFKVGGGVTQAASSRHGVRCLLKGPGKIVHSGGSVLSICELFQLLKFDFYSVYFGKRFLYLNHSLFKVCFKERSESLQNKY